MINRLKTLARYAGLGALGLPRLDAVEATPEQAEAFSAAADRVLTADGGVVDELPSPKMDFLRWLAENRPVAFHGSSNAELDELRPIRMSEDTSAFGSQQAVYATPDVVWAAWFAVVRRDRLRWMRNGSMGVPGDRVYPRWYFFALERLDELAGMDRFRPGTLYVLPRQPFRPEHPRLGIGAGGQMVSEEAVRPLARVPVEPSDVPFLELTPAMKPGERELRTLRNFGAAHRRSRRGRSKDVAPL